MTLQNIETKIEEIKMKMKDPNLCADTAAIYSRISGYWRPIENWNNGKQAEFMERREYRIAD